MAEVDSVMEDLNAELMRAMEFMVRIADWMAQARAESLRSAERSSRAGASALRVIHSEELELARPMFALPKMDAFWEQPKEVVLQTYGIARRFADTDPDAALAARECERGMAKRWGVEPPTNSPIVGVPPIAPIYPAYPGESTSLEDWKKIAELATLTPVTSPSPNYAEESPQVTFDQAPLEAFKNEKPPLIEDGTELESAVRLAGDADRALAEALADSSGVETPQVSDARSEVAEAQHGVDGAWDSTQARQAWAASLARKGADPEAERAALTGDKILSTPASLAAGVKKTAKMGGKKPQKTSTARQKMRR